MDRANGHGSKPRTTKRAHETSGKVGKVKLVRNGRELEATADYEKKISLF